MTLKLEGLANDFVGKGLCGGELVIRGRGRAAQQSEKHTLLGNVALYGATSGYLFAAGRAGERFAVRNSGALAIVEGVGDHACEYMTGGLAVVLGSTGINFGAGMTGGLAWVYDEDGEFLSTARFHKDFLRPETWEELDPCGRQSIRDLVESHATKTSSTRAHWLMANWEDRGEEIRASHSTAAGVKHIRGRPTDHFRWTFFRRFSLYISSSARVTRSFRVSCE